MPNNNVAIVSLMAKFDEKSVEDAAKKLGKTTEQALSNVGQDKFGQEIVDQFNEAMNIIKKKLKSVNLSSYTGNILDSLFSNKDISEKTKDLQKFISNISNLSKSLSGLSNNALNSMTPKQLDAVIAKQEKIAQKNEEIATKTKELENMAKNISNQKRSVSTIKKSYGESDYEKLYESLKKLFVTETEFDNTQQKSIKHLSEMLALYSDMEKIEPVQGTSEAIKYSSDLLAIVKEIKKTSEEVDLFTNGKASKFVSENFDSTKQVNKYGVLSSQQDFVKNGLKNLNAQKAKLEKDLTEYISSSVQKNLQKITNDIEKVVDKATTKVDKLQQKVDTLKGNGVSESPIINNIVDESQVKTLEELEDRLYSIYDKDSEGDASTKELKEFISLYQQYEKIIDENKSEKLDPDLKDEYDAIIQADKAMQKYADSLKEAKTNKEVLSNVDSSSQTSTQLKEQETHIQNIEKATKDLVDTQKTVSNTSITVDAEKAIESIKQVKENLESIPNEKNIKITVNNIDYSSVPLLSDSEGKTVDAFRGVTGAWSGLINQDGIAFFTDKMKLAADYADSLAESGKVYKANLSFANPLEVEGNGATWDKIDFNGITTTTDEIVEIAKSLGYDGVIFRNIRDGFADTEEDISNVMVALDKAQIKNEQVIGVVKAGTGELTSILDVDTSSSIVESQEKVQESLQKTEQQAVVTTEAEKKLAEVKKETPSSISSSDNSKIEELKTDIQEVKTELGDVKDRITSIESNGFENVREDVEKTKESVKELNGELTEMKSNLSSSTSAETNISSGLKDAFQGSDTKLDETVSTAKELDKTLEQVDIPTDSFDTVLKKLDLAKSELIDIVKITKQSVSDADGKFHNSYTLKDSRGSTEIYGENSKTDKGQLLHSNIVGYDKKKDELDISKAQLEVDKQLVKEEEELAKAQQTKWESAQKEQSNYESEQKKVDALAKQKAAYDELMNTIKQYAEVAKRVAGGNAEDDDIDKMSKLEDKISQLQKQPILSSSQVEKSEKSLVSLYDQLDKIERKLVETNQKTQDKRVAGFDKRLSGYESKVTNYQATANKFKDGGWTSDAYKEQIDKLNKAIGEYKTLLAGMQNDPGLVTDESIQKLNKYESEIKEVISTVSNMSAAEKGFTLLSAQKELDKINSILNENTAMSREAKKQIKAYYAQIKSGNPSASLDVIHGKIMEIVNAEAEAGRVGKSMWAAIKEKAWYGVVGAVGTYFGINDIFRYAKEGIQVVREFDTALTEMKKVSDETTQSLKNYQATTFDTADAVGTTALQIQNSTADYMRLGESLEEASESAKTANILLNVSEFDNIEDATKSLVSMGQAYKDLDKLTIVDKLNEVGRRLLPKHTAMYGIFNMLFLGKSVKSQGWLRPRFLI